jgi:outer membrane lipoprotein SlyB
MNNGHVLKLSAAALATALSLSACTDSQQRVAAGGALGAVAGGLIGGAVGGGRGAVIGAIAGGIGGLIIADAIEQQRAREAALYAARTGGATTQSFRNSKGEAVVVRARTVRTYTASSGQRVRVVERQVTRNGQDVGKDTVEAKEVKLAGGGSEWTGIE